MPLITDREQVREIYTEAETRKWVLPAFNSENLTTSEAILQAVYDFGRKMQVSDLPVIIGITGRYPDRPQSVYYAHNRQWDLGLRLFLRDLQVLTDKDSPYAKLRVMIHLDHIRWDLDAELLTWDMKNFSSIMYDASTLPFGENIIHTARFVEKMGQIIFIEGACDEIGENTFSGDQTMSAARAQDYYRQTGVDLIVVNLGTEHRAAESKLNYKRDLARKITALIGPRLCLHGSSSVARQNLGQLFADGVRKVNLWTALERESTSILFQDMLSHVTSMAGPDRVKKWINDKLLGEGIETNGVLSAEYFTTTYRQQIVYKAMQQIVKEYLNLWYV
jgi:fructose/tagatose bisphosphate aldolase